MITKFMPRLSQTLSFKKTDLKHNRPDYNNNPQNAAAGNDSISFKSAEGKIFEGKENNQGKADARTLAAIVFMGNPIQRIKPDIPEPQHYFINHKNPQGVEFDKDEWKYDDKAAADIEWHAIETMDNDLLPPAAHDKIHLYALKTDKNCDLLAPFERDKTPFILRLIKYESYRSLEYLFNDPQRAGDLLKLKIDGKSLFEYARSHEMCNFLGYQEAKLISNIKPAHTPQNIEPAKTPATRVPEDIKHYYVNHDDPYSEDFEKTIYSKHNYEKTRDIYNQAIDDGIWRNSLSDRHLYAQIKAMKDFDLLQSKKEYSNLPSLGFNEGTWWWEHEDSPLIFAMVEAGEFHKTMSYLLSDPKRYNELINLEYNGKKLPDYADTKSMQELFKLKAVEMENAEAQEKFEKMENASKPNAAAKGYTQEAAPAEADNIQIQRPETPAIEAAQTEEKQNTDFFNAFEEVDDTNTPQQESVAASMPKERKPLPDSFKSYTILNITDKDPKTVDEIIGMNKIKQDLKNNVIIPLNQENASETLKANDINIPNGILIETGQDAANLVKALSNETGMPVLELLNPEELKPMLADIQKAYEETGMKTVVLIRDFDKFFTTGPNCDIEKKNFMLAAENCIDKGALFFIRSALTLS